MYGLAYLSLEILVVVSAIIWLGVVKMTPSPGVKRSLQRQRINLLALVLILSTLFFAFQIAPGTNGYPQGSNALEQHLSPPTSFLYRVVDSAWFYDRVSLEGSYYMAFIETTVCTFTFTKAGGYEQTVQITIRSTSAYMQREYASTTFDIEPGDYQVSVETTDGRDIDIKLEQHQRDGRDLGQILFDYSKWGLLGVGVLVSVYFIAQGGGWKDQNYAHSPYAFIKSKHEKEDKQVSPVPRYDTYSEY